MATIPLMGTGVKLPDYNMGETFVNIARLKAFEQQRRIDEMKLGQAERNAAREEEWRTLWGEVFQPQGQHPGTSGLTGASPQAPPQSSQTAPGQAQPPAGPQMSLADARAPGPPPVGNQAASIPPAVGGTYAMPQGGNGTFAMRHIPPEDMGLTAAPPAMQPMAALMGPQGGQLGATGSPVQDYRETQQANVGMSAVGASPPPAPAQQQFAAPTPPQGLATERPGLPEMPGLQMPQMNEAAFWRAYQKDPERTTKEFGNLLEVQGKKLEQTEKTNDLVYNALLAVERSDDPAAMWPRALKSLRDKGVPTPNMPETYDPALASFLKTQHEGVKTRVENARERYYDAQAMQNRALGQKQLSEVKTAQERQLEVQQKLATLDKTIAETSDIPLKRDLEKQRVNLQAEDNVLKAIKLDLEKDDLALRRSGQTQTAQHQKTTSEQSALGEWNKVAAPYKDMSDAYAMIESGAKDKKGGPASDQLIVNGFLRLLDNKTGIRDAERRDFLTSGGLLQAIQRGEAYITGTTQLRPEFKKDILARTNDAYKQAMQDYDQRMVDFRGIAERQKLDPNNVVVDFRSTGKKAQSQPPSAATRATADPTSGTINKEDFMQWRQRNGYKGPVKETEVTAYFQQRGGRE